ncbi:MAG TPA: hypothetical protein VF529_00620 [Solirubrobacteraceae bacterium]|jgi:hypothetical protein
MGSASLLRSAAVRLVIAVVAVFVTAVAPAAAQDMSPNVTSVASLPEVRAAISINFIDDVMFVSTVGGLYSYDVSDPTDPQLLGALPMYVWENEDVDVDPVRKRVFISRDPRGFTSPATPGSFPVGAVHVIDVSNPRVMTQAGFFTLPAGHTSTCVNGCDFLWTGGPVPGVDQPSDWDGRPIFATDVRDPANPVPCPEPIDTGRNDGKTDYAHDVQVDAAGVAWVSGAGGVRGYWTRGRHRNPVTRRVEVATPCDPVPYGGSGTPESATPSRFMHNAFRDPSARHGERILYGTEENITSDCASSGRFVTYDLRDTLRGEGFRDTARTKHRMRALDTWTPEGAGGSSGCASAHYFSSRGDGVFANAFYEQGVRFLDVSDPQDIRQIGWWRPSDANTWAAYWHDGYVFVADLQRGVEVLRFEGEAGRAKNVRGPNGGAARARLRMDRGFGYLCPLDAVAPSGAGVSAKADAIALPAG